MFAQFYQRVRFAAAVLIVPCAVSLLSLLTFHFSSILGCLVTIAASLFGALMVISEEDRDGRISLAYIVWLVAGIVMTTAFFFLHPSYSYAYFTVVVAFGVWSFAILMYLADKVRQIPVRSPSPKF
ncbi:MAG: hypothetical protein JWN89_645 [Parcubacteria group bacterium]|nr:hypothetical protein [Parcubacteria group bacterium]